MEALEDSGAARETLVLYLTDHGEMLGNHGFWAKSVMYEDSVGIPLIFAGGELPVGVNHTPVSLTDIAATVEAAVGLAGDLVFELMVVLAGLLSVVGVLAAEAEGADDPRATA